MSETLRGFVRRLGVSGEDAQPGAFGIDLNNVVIGDPYWEGTGFLPDRETAEAVAALLLAAMDREAGTGEDSGDESWATIVSLAGQEDGGEPEYEETYFGDAWFVASVGLNLLDDDQRRQLGKVLDVINNMVVDVINTKEST